MFSFILRYISISWYISVSISDGKMETVSDLQRGKVLHIQIGKVRTHLDENNTSWDTAIYKDLITIPIATTARGLVGDERTGYDVDRALCCQSVDNYRFWRAYFRRDLPLGIFGENLVLEGYTDDSICIGDIVRVGTVLLQITQSRTPCY